MCIVLCSHDTVSRAWRPVSAWHQNDAMCKIVFFSQIVFAAVENPRDGTRVNRLSPQVERVMCHCHLACTSAQYPTTLASASHETCSRLYCKAEAQPAKQTCLQTCLKMCLQTFLQLCLRNKSENTHRHLRHGIRSWQTLHSWNGSFWKYACTHACTLKCVHAQDKRVTTICMRVKREFPHMNVFKPYNMKIQFARDTTWTQQSQDHAWFLQRDAGAASMTHIVTQNEGNENFLLILDKQALPKAKLHKHHSDCITLHKVFKENHDRLHMHYE